MKFRRNPSSQFGLAFSFRLCSITSDNHFNVTYLNEFPIKYPYNHTAPCPTVPQTIIFLPESLIFQLKFLLLEGLLANLNGASSISCISKFMILLSKNQKIIIVKEVSNGKLDHEGLLRFLKHFEVLVVLQGPSHKNPVLNNRGPKH